MNYEICQDPCEDSRPLLNPRSFWISRPAFGVGAENQTMKAHLDDVALAVCLYWEDARGVTAGKIAPVEVVSNVAEQVECITRVIRIYADFLDNASYPR
jgi:hypothetical protein